MKLFLLLVCLCLCSSVALWFWSDLRKARARLEGTSQIITTPFGKIEYASQGTGSPILVIHGGPGGFDQGMEMTSFAADLGYQLIVPSRFGYLHSEMPISATNALQADAYAALIQKLGLHKVNVLAISAGTWSALEFAASYPQFCEALVLLVPANPLPPGKQNFGGSVVKAMLESDFMVWVLGKAMPFVPQIGSVVFGTPVAIIRSANKQEQQRLQNLLQHLLPLSLRTAGIQMDVRSAVKPTPVEFGKITCPVLAISTEDDIFSTLTRATYIVRHVQNGRAIIFPTGGHALVGRQNEVLHEIMAFLNSIPSVRDDK